MRGLPYLVAPLGYRRKKCNLKHLSWMLYNYINARSTFDNCWVIATNTGRIQCWLDYDSLQYWKVGLKLQIENLDHGPWYAVPEHYVNEGYAERGIEVFARLLLAVDNHE